MTSKRLSISLIFALLVLFTNASAQTPEGDALPSATAQSEDAQAKEEEEEARAATQTRAFALLDEVVAEAASLKLAESRIRIQMRVAGLLWELDGERARALFKEAQDSLIALINTTDPTDPQSQDMMPVISQMRHEIMGMLANRDPQAALNFLRATRLPPATQHNSQYNAPDQELVLELNLAMQIAAQDPKQALRMAEESLSKGVSNPLIGVLQSLRVKDAESARKLSASIIQKLRTTDFSKDYEAANVASNLLTMTRPNIVATSGGATERVDQPVPALDEQARRELIDVVAGAVVNGTAGRTNQQLFRSLRNIMPEVEKSAPTRVAALRRRMSEVDRNADPRRRFWREHEDVMQNGTVDSLLEAAQKAPAEMREQLYGQAAWKAVGQGDFERARQLLGNIANPQQRAHMLKEIERQIASRAIEQGNLAEAQQMLTRLASIEERAPALLNLARVAADKKLEKEARAYREEARSLLGGRAANQSLFSLQLQLAQTYAATEPERAFEILEGAVDHLNELVAAAATINGFGQDAFKDGELRLQGGYMWNELVAQCAGGLGALARVDFDRARAATERFARPDTRVMARLVIVQSMLDKYPAANQIRVRERGRSVISPRISRDD